MFISVALCTYNGEKYVKSQIESILRQTVKVSEIIICDDRSTDATIDIIKDLTVNSEIDISVLINEQNLGSTKNFEKVISNCSGDIIFLADQDDIWDEQKVEKIIKIFKNNKDVGLVFTNAELINEHGELINSAKSKLWDIYIPNENAIHDIMSPKAFEILIRRNFITGATMAFRRECITENINIPISWVHDHFIALLVSDKYQIYALNEDLIQYRIHPNQQIGLGDMSIMKKINTRRINKEKLQENEMKRLVESLNVEYLISNEHMQNIKDYIEYCKVRQEVKKSGYIKKLKKFYSNKSIYCKYERTVLRMFIDFFNV